MLKDENDRLRAVIKGEMEWAVERGNCKEVLRQIPDESVHTVVTSPPYWGLRDYGVPGQIGLEETPEKYVDTLVSIFREVRRGLRKDGTVWLNLGDSYQDKQLVGIPWRVAFALQSEGWYLRTEIIWEKPNAMPESVKDRPTRAHEYIFLLAKSKKYYYDHEAIKEDAVNGDPAPPRGSRGVLRGNNKGLRKQDLVGKRTYTGFNARYKPLSKRNKRTVWRVSTRPFPGTHFATFPPELIEPCILSGCPKGGIVLDPFSGSGTAGIVALRNGRKYIGIELNPEYVEMSRRRIVSDAPLLNM